MLMGEWVWWVGVWVCGCVGSLMQRAYRLDVDGALLVAGHIGAVHGGGLVNVNPVVGATAFLAFLGAATAAPFVGGLVGAGGQVDVL